eukprot:2290788-Prymnesium_polylepis.1
MVPLANRAERDVVLDCPLCESLVDIRPQLFLARHHVLRVTGRRACDRCVVTCPLARQLLLARPLADCFAAVGRRLGARLDALAADTQAV